MRSGPKPNVTVGRGPCAVASSLLLLGLVGGCGEPVPPRAQALVYLDTDAPVPRFVSRLRLVVLDGDLAPACPTCSRSFAVDEQTRWPISFGVAAPADGAPRLLRATLFPAGRTQLGEPEAATAIDVIVALGFDGVEAQSILLSLDCAGRPPDLRRRLSCRSREAPAAPIAPAAAGPGGGSLVGSWNRAYARPCRGQAQPDTALLDGEVCIEGGVFWMGDYRLRGFGAGDGVPEHAVAVSPFFLERSEFTVGRYRALVAQGYVPRQRPVTSADFPQCTLSPMADGSLPLSCVSALEAANLCRRVGRRLPTEAEWEWAAGSGEQELLYPWGDALQPLDLASAKAIPVRSRKLDRTANGLFDVLANLGEHTADRFDRYSGRCWTPGAYGPNPRCDAARAESPDFVVARGGHFGIEVPRVSIPARAALPEVGIPLELGFRCARDDR